ncbi:hypothetical protein K402DRAFT_42971 [Aulographum hederae CBS 113979]|uniref:BTB domain-containing protein n=1 Tax=Aulographum hederae CBS 113979 TaxID=1176131 RepID=A0A6G1H3A6_9PEZI|nr:hypothetical protein K402DRAFT_42971 [Aulographum hederae CBS 113979]
MFNLRRIYSLVMNPQTQALQPNQQPQPYRLQEILPSIFGQINSSVFPIRITTNAMGHITTWTVPRALLYRNSLFVPGLLSHPPLDLLPNSDTFEIERRSFFGYAPELLMHWLSTGLVFPTPHDVDREWHLVDELWELAKVGVMIADAGLFNACVRVLLQHGERCSAHLHVVAREVYEVTAPRGRGKELRLVVARAIAKESLAQPREVPPEVPLVAALRECPGLLTEVFTQIGRLTRPNAWDDDGQYYMK